MEAGSLVAIVGTFRALVDISAVGVIVAVGTDLELRPEARLTIARETAVQVDTVGVCVAIVGLRCWQHFRERALVDVRTVETISPVAYGEQTTGRSQSV